jgi:hypothetical protein
VGEGVKLSKPQLELLQLLGQKGPRFVVDYYPPVKVLIRLGLAEYKGRLFCITEAGAKQLKP